MRPKPRCRALDLGFRVLRFGVSEWGFRVHGLHGMSCDFCVLQGFRRVSAGPVKNQNW